MIQIKFGILLHVNLTKVNTSNEKKRQRESETSKNKNSKRSPKLGSPVGSLHISYVLIPGSSQCGVDVLYWDELVKIFTESSSVTYKVKNEDNKIWIPIFLIHEYPQMNDKSLMDLYSHIVEVDISTEKKKLGNSARNYKLQSIELPESPLLFVQIPDENDKNVVQSVLKSGEGKLLPSEETILHSTMLSIIDKTSKNEIVAYCKEYIPNPIYAPEEEHIKLTENSVDNFNFEIPPKQKLTKEQMKKREKIKKQKKNQTPKHSNEVKIKLSGEVFFSDPKLSVYSLSEADEVLKNCYVLLSVTNLLTNVQEDSINPFVIKLESIKNLPIDILKRQGFHTVYLQYTIPQILLANSLEKKVNRNIKINESHAFLNLNSAALLQYLQTNKFLVELLGNFSDDQPYLLKKCPDNSNYEENNCEEILRVKPKQTVLAVAAFDLSALINSTVTYEFIVDFCHPSHLLCQPSSSMCYNMQLTNPISINNVNLSLNQDKYLSPLTNDVLLVEGTSLKIVVYTTTPLYGIPELLAMSQPFKRLIVVVHETDVATVLLNEILIHNQDYVSSALFPKYESCNGFIESDTGENMITGFFIDNGTSSLFVIESSNHNYTFELIWNQIKTLNENILKAFYNSDHTFKYRIYKTFKSIGGVLNIILKWPLQEIFSMKDVYIKGNVPIPCFKALQKLELLMRCQTSKEIHQYALLPTAQEMVSFDMEFGVPTRINN